MFTLPKLLSCYGHFTIYHFVIDNVGENSLYDNKAHCNIFIDTLFLLKYIEMKLTSSNKLKTTRRTASHNGTDI